MVRPQEEEFESLSFAGVSANGEDFESDELLCASYGVSLCFESFNSSSSSSVSQPVALSE